MRHFSIRTIIPLAGLAALTTSVRAFELDDTLYRDAKQGVRLRVPEGWALATQTGYPALFAVLTSPKGDASITAAITRLAPGESLERCVSNNNSGIRAVGLLVADSKRTTISGREVWEVSANSRNRRRELRQVYLAQGSRVLIFSLACPAGTLSAFVEDLLYLVRNCTLE